MDNNAAQKTRKYKLIIFIGIEFLVVLTIFLLIFFAGRRTYTVTFDINGGELLGGDLEQEVRRGGSATPPNVARQGCYLLRWSGSYNKVTGDVTCTAVWEYETTAGIEYEVVENGNYCLVSGCYKELSGDVYVGSYYKSLKVLGIKDGAFKDCKYIESLFFLDGIISIGERAFEGCESLESITLPKTTEQIGAMAFQGCKSLTDVTIPDKVKIIGDRAFYECDALTEINVPASVVKMGVQVFDNPNLTIIVDILKEEIPETWEKAWVSHNKQVKYFTPENDDDTTEEQ